MTHTTDITLIGGGVIGLLTARALINAGASVTIIDKALLGQESSWAGGGILLPLYPWRQAEAISQLAVHSLSLYPSLATQLFEDTNKDPEWTPCGLLITKNPDINDAIAWCQQHGIRFQPAEDALFNNLVTQTEQPLWLPDIAQARNPRLVKSLKQDLINKGVTLIENCELTAIRQVQNTITHIETSTGLYPVKDVIISAGAWTGALFQKLFKGLMASPTIAPVKGQMLLFEAEAGLLPSMVLDGDHYLIPRRDGKILAGSTVEHDGFNKHTTDTARNDLTDFALSLLPALKHAPLLHHWAGLRPGTELGIPYIDRHPDISNLSINAGHFRNGLVMGPASAQLMVDLLLNLPTSVDPEPYRLGR
jgi:glycine oxidase